MTSQTKRSAAVLLLLAAISLGSLAATPGCKDTTTPESLHTAVGILEFTPGIQSQPEGVLAKPVPDKIMFQSYILSIKSDRVLSAALAKLGTEQTLYTGETALFDLAGDLRVMHLPDTFNISVSLRGSDAAQTAAVVRAVLDAYIEEEDAFRKEDYAYRSFEICAEREELQQKATRLAIQLSALRRQGEGILDEKNGEEIARLNALARQLADVQLELGAARVETTQFDKLHQAAVESNDFSPLLDAFGELQDRFDRDPLLLALERELAFAQIRVATLRATDDDAAVRRADAEVQATQKVLEEKKAEVAARLCRRHSTTLQAKYARAREVEANLFDEVTEARLKAIQVALNAADYRMLEEELRRQQELLATVSDALERMRINSALVRPSIRIIMYPQTPVRPTATPRGAA